MDYTNNFDEFKCYCGQGDFLLVKSEKSNGTICYRYQCQNCGWNSDFIKKNTIPNNIDLENLPLHNPDISKEYWDNRAKERDLEYQLQRIEARRERQRLLQEYYCSPEWQERRARAIKRNNLLGGFCERCGVKLEYSNTCVHHRTYDFLDKNVTDEMRNLLKGKESNQDLEVLCRKCHDLLHEHLYYGVTYDYC